ncbi:MAG: pseudouridine synthase [Tardiphaga sp.]|uniref:pseudouridine synthase n=1 Tax=Tardiphaga sp. TaxID=1926292 RepID=UPI0019A56908|nr:pseudouridine synthase [Tardiphaga sp.]MBC7583275.1 pseudouridine synthase [Tardiphaga sp.]
MPRDNDRNNGPSRGRPPGKSGGGASKGRSGAARGPEKKFAKRDGTYAPKPHDAGAAGERKTYGAKPYSGPGKPYAGKREGAAPRRDDDRAPRRDYGDAPRPARSFGGDRPERSGGDKRPYQSRDGGGEKRPYTPRDVGGEKRPYSPRPAGGDKRPYQSRDGGGEKRPYTPRDGGGEKRPYTPREGGGEKRPYSPRGDRPTFNRDDRAPRSDARPAGRSDDRKFGEKRPYTPRDGGGEKRPYQSRDGGDKRPYTPRDGGDRPRPSGDRPYSARLSRDNDRPRSDRPQGDRPFSGGSKFGGDKKFSRGAPDRGGPRKTFGDRPDRGADRGESKPWQKREEGDRNARPSRDGARQYERPKFERTEFPRVHEERPRFERASEARPKFDRPRERPSNDFHEHPRNNSGLERPRRDNEDDSRIFAKRPAFGGRGDYRERKPEERRPPRPPAPKKDGERVAKVVSRAGLCSRRDAEDWVTQGRVAVNGRIINSPALDVTTRDVITVDGKPLPAPERTRLFMYHKPRGLMTTHADPEGRPTVFDHLPEHLPRLISIGRLDFNTEGLLLLTNDGGLARTLELPDTGWLRRYRVRAHGEVTQSQLDQLKHGVEVDGVKYGSIDATLERDQGANVWLVFAIREGKNREVRNVLAHLGLEVNRLIRISYGPFQLGELEEGGVEEVKTRVLREQLGEKIAEASGADFARQIPSKGDPSDDPIIVKKPEFKRSTTEDRKGRRVLVQRTGSEESRTRNEEEASGYGPPKRPKRGYHGKRDITPRKD